MTPLQLEDRNRSELQQRIEQVARYANITVIEGIGASQFESVWCPRAHWEMVLRDERAVIPIGSYNAAYGVTLLLPGIVGRKGVVQILETRPVRGRTTSTAAQR